MNRKIVALLLAVMLVASSVSAMAELVTVGGKTYLSDADVEKLAAFNYNKIFDNYNQPTSKYEIAAEGLYVIYDVYAFSLDTKMIESKKDYASLTDDEAVALKKANGSFKVIEQIVEYKNVVTVEQPDYNALLVYAAKEGYAEEHIHKVANNKYFLYKNASKFEYVTLTGEYDMGIKGEDVSGLPTSGTDSFNHHYTNYNKSELINSVAFAPKAFGNGVAFEHTAKSLFTINVKYDCNAWIQIRDAEGRLYPVANASWEAAKNAYAIKLNKGENTISWFGTDGAKYHINGTAAAPKTIELDVNMNLETVEKNMVTGKVYFSDRVDIRFDYIVRHGDAHHVASDAAASAPKTGDAGMAYMTLAALIVMMGAAVVVTRKVRNF